MGKKTWIKLIIRSIILLVATVVMFFDKNILFRILNFSVLGELKIYHIFWLYLMYEMIAVVFPKLSLYTYNGKHFKNHYLKAENINRQALSRFTKENTRRALKAATFWITLNGIIGFIYFKFDISKLWIYWLFLFYYWSDMFCVNVWCPFHKIIVRNKCCNECRIYNWGHIMYFTPFIFIPSMWTTSLLLMSFIIFIQWEYQNYRYPERFSSISNVNLRCSSCRNKCRFNKKKRYNYANKNNLSMKSIGNKSIV